MNTNLSAFLDVIAMCEVGTLDPIGYRALYGFTPSRGKPVFDSFAGHPRQAFQSSWGWTSAAGRYQAMCAVPGKVKTDTWGDFMKAKGPHDFSPASQDEFALWCITRRKAMDDVLAGRFQTAITKCSNEWASLPGSIYGQPMRTMDYCLAVYAKAGGLLRPVPDTIGVTKPVSYTSAKTAPNVQHIGQQPKESPVGATLLAGLIPSILSLFSGRAQAAISKATGASPEVVQKFTADLAQQIESVSGVAVTDTATAMKAAAVVANDPAKVAELEQRATNFVLAEMGGGLRGAQEEYAAINRDYDDDPAWRIAAKFLFNPVHWVTGVFLFYVQQFIPPLADKVKALDGAAAMGLIVIVFGVIAVVGVRWLGSYTKQQQD